MSHQRERESGQALVETALTLPLVLFLILGTLQLFMLLQARIMAQYAVYKAVRSGSLNQGSCLAMTHSAIAALMPTIAWSNTPQRLADSFRLRNQNRYDPNWDGQHDGQIVEFVRESPAIPVPDENTNDHPGVNNILAVRMIYWYRMKIPFANWVMSQMFLAHFGLDSFVGSANPLIPAERRRWEAGNASFGNDSWPGGALGPNMASWAANDRQYLFPIRVSMAMRMMTPPKAAFFNAQECPLNPPQNEGNLISR